MRNHRRPPLRSTRSRARQPAENPIEPKVTWAKNLANAIVSGLQRRIFAILGRSFLLVIY